MADASPKKKKKAVPGWAVTLGARLFQLLRRSWRVRRTDRAGIVDGDGKPWPIIAVLWHNRIPVLADFFPRRLQRQSAGLASASRDGEAAARVLKAFGYQAVRGSSSRGGFEALLGLRKKLDEGVSVALTVDGPRGPKYEVHPGAVLLAEQTGVPIVPFALRSPRRWELKGWDRMQIPKPFSRVEFIIGEPLHVPPDLTPEQRREWCEKVREALLAITDDSRKDGTGDLPGDARAVEERREKEGRWRLVRPFDLATARAAVELHQTGGDPAVTSLKNEKKRAVSRVRVGDKSFIVKVFRIQRRPFTPAPDAICWANSRRLAACGLLPGGACLAWLRTRDRRGYLVMEDLGERHLVTELKAAGAARARLLLRQAGTLMARLHAGRIFHKDLKIGNFMVASGNGCGGDRVTVIDLDAVRFDRELTPERKSRNLGQFVEGFQARFGLPPAYNRWFLAAYRRELRMPRREFRALLTRLPAE